MSTATACPDCGEALGARYPTPDGTEVCWPCWTTAEEKVEGAKPLRGLAPSTSPGAAPETGAQSQNGAQNGVVEEKVPGASPLRHLALGTSPGGVRFTTRKLDASEFRPVEFAWEERLVKGVLNLLAGTEGIGKGTLLAWVIAQLTRGGLPGAFKGSPARVLWLGDEDSWTDVVGPRLYAAGADLSLVEEMTAPDGRPFNVQNDASELDRIITTGRFDVVVFEALLDHMPAGRGGDPTQHVRTSLAPTRAVLRRRGTTALATMHTRKGPSSSFRDLMAGSHQYNALSRSSLLLAVHPDDEGRRIIVPGKQNYSRAATTESFELAGHAFDLNEHRFSVSLAHGFRAEPDITIDSLLASPRTDARDELREQVLGALTDEPQARAEIARAVGRDPKDGSVGRVLGDLHAEGQVARTGTESRPLWKVAGGKPPSTAATCHLPEDALFEPNGHAKCGDCGATLTSFGGRLICVGCAS